MPNENSFTDKSLYLYLAWMIALLSTAGSFFFSQILKLPPCDLCWYQRIFMFPLVITLGVGFLLKDPKAAYYSFPLMTAGWLIAFYHNLLYYKFISAALAPCTSGVSCTEKQLDLFGFLSIPLMSLVSFSILIALLILHFRKGQKL